MAIFGRDRVTPRNPSTYYGAAAGSVRVSPQGAPGGEEEGEGGSGEDDEDEEDERFAKDASEFLGIFDAGTMSHLANVSLKLAVWPAAKRSLVKIGFGPAAIADVRGAFERLKPENIKTLQEKFTVLFEQVLGGKMGAFDSDAVKEMLE